jgi:hypothetical protein
MRPRGKEGAILLCLATHHFLLKSFKKKTKEAKGQKSGCGKKNSCWDAVTNHAQNYFMKFLLPKEFYKNYLFILFYF